MQTAEITHNVIALALGDAAAGRPHQRQAAQRERYANGANNPREPAFIEGWCCGVKPIGQLGADDNQRRSGQEWADKEETAEHAHR